MSSSKGGFRRNPAAFRIAISFYVSVSLGVTCIKIGAVEIGGEKIAMGQRTRKIPAKSLTGFSPLRSLPESDNMPHCQLTPNFVIPAYGGKFCKLRT